MTTPMKHLTELLDRLEASELAYKQVDSSLDCSPLELIITREEVKQARFAFDKACRAYVLANVFGKEEIV